MNYREEEEQKKKEKICYIGCSTLFLVTGVLIYFLDILYTMACYGIICGIGLPVLCIFEIYKKKNVSDSDRIIFSVIYIVIGMAIFFFSIFGIMKHSRFIILT